ncbi:hypothetical protein [Photorhabdus luminescens]|uniref:hypothetical protein n=1 Tax=Photorhabdus luminescens TaxID=29488 RepID=UPI001130A2FA|nr:hypothetical protein [Photorhabdus luminescens]
MIFSTRYPLQTKGFARNRKWKHVNNHWQAVIYLRGEVFYIDVEIAPYRQLGCTVKAQLTSTVLSSANRHCLNSAG